MDTYKEVSLLVKSRDVQRLKSALYGEYSSREAALYGGVARAVVTGIAVMPQYDRELVELALEIATPWVEPWQLATFVDIAVPYAHIFEPAEATSKFSMRKLEQRLPVMAEDEILQFFRHIANGGADQLPRSICDAIARRVFDLSRHSCLFKSGQRTLLVYASMIPLYNTELEEDDDNDEPNTETDSNATSGDASPLFPPYSI